MPLISVSVMLMSSAEGEEVGGKRGVSQSSQLGGWSW